MPEPSVVGQFGVAFARLPGPSVLGAVHTIVLWGVAHFLSRPVGLTCPTLFVANPSGLTAHTPQDDVGADLMNGVAQVGNVVIRGAVHLQRGVASAIVSVAAIGAIEPHLKLIVAILSQLSTLAQEHIVDISVGSVVQVVAIPWRHIEAIFQF